jgi:hypothetical protein
MPEDYATLLAEAEKTGEGRVKISHLATQFDHLNKLYDDEGTRDAAHILAKDWLESGEPLRKAATAEWAKERKISVGDKPDPNATPPKPNDLSDGIDAPDSGPKAAGAGVAENKPQDNPSDNDGKKHPGATMAPKKGVNTITKLKAMKARRMAPAAHAGTNATAAAYEAGVRDATAKHAHAAHRIGSLTARHAFQMGAEAGHRMASNAHAAAGAGRLAVPTQAGITHPGHEAPAQMAPAMKGDLAGSLAKAFGALKKRKPVAKVAAVSTAKTSRATELAKLAA